MRRHPKPHPLQPACPQNEVLIFLGHDFHLGIFWAPGLELRGDRGVGGEMAGEVREEREEERGEASSGEESSCPKAWRLDWG